MGLRKNLGRNDNVSLGEAKAELIKSAGNQGAKGTGRAECPFAQGWDPFAIGNSIYSQKSLKIGFFTTKLFFSQLKWR